MSPAGLPAAGERWRVLRLITKMDVGGATWQATALTEGLDPDDFETRLVVGNVGPGEGDFLELRAPHLPVKRVDGLGRSVKPGADVRALFSIVAEIRRYRPHVVHTHTAKAGVLGRVAARACGVPVIVHTFHGHLLKGYFTPRVTAAIRLLERVLAHAATHLAAVGEQVRDELLAAGIGRPEQYAVVPPGVPRPEAEEVGAARRALGLPEDALVVTFVGRLTRVKRPDRFAAVALALAEDPRVVFVIAGEGPLLDDLRQQVAPLGGRARFLGWRSDVGRVYAAADVVVLTSDNEGMPVSLIEASMTGRPCVTTDVGSAREVVLHAKTGFVTSTEVADIAAAVRRLLDDEGLRTKLGDAARAHAERCFGTSRLVGDYERLYRDALAARGMTRGVTELSRPAAAAG